MTDEKKITAIILAGGKSSRMGTDKGLVEFEGMEMIARVLENVKQVTDDVLIISNNSAYKKFGCPVFEDIYKDCGPLGGIHTGLMNSKTDWNLIVGCDLPFITSDFFEFLFSNISHSDAIVPLHHSLAEPLCALYHKSSLPKIESLLLKRELKMQRVLKILGSKFIEVPEIRFDASVLFKNINLPADIKILAK